MNGLLAVPLYGKHGAGLVTVVDESDARLIGDHRWHRHSSGYVLRSVGRDSIYLHRVIAGLAPGDGFEVDHKDRNPLNNRRSNLRVTVHAQNGQNQSARPGSSPHRGVSWARHKSKWRAFGKVSGKWKHLGYFDDADRAAEVARQWRLTNMTHTVEP